MKRIKKLVHKIDEELCGAEHYAEKAIEYKADGDRSNLKVFYENFPMNSLQVSEEDTYNLSTCDKWG